MACAFTGEDVTAGEDPVEMRIVVLDRFDGAADIGEELADLVLARGEPPFGK
jgi:hypothetical protein